MRRDHQDASRSRNAGTKVSPSIGVAVVLKRIHRAPVPQERSRHQVRSHVISSRSGRIGFPLLCTEVGVYTHFAIAVMVGAAIETIAVSVGRRVEPKWVMSLG